MHNKDWRKAEYLISCTRNWAVINCDPTKFNFLPFTAKRSIVNLILQVNSERMKNDKNDVLVELNFIT